MAFATRTALFLTVTIAGIPMPLAWVEQATDGVSPEVGSATIRIPLGNRAVGGAIMTAELIVTNRSDVLISDGATYRWTGEVVSVEEMGAKGSEEEPGGRWLVVECQGYAGALERAYLSTWRMYDYATAAPVQCLHSRDLNALRNPDRSGATYLVNGQLIYVTDVYGITRGFWTQGQAIASILCVANADAGLPVMSLSDPSGLMTKENTWPIAGRSVQSMLATVIGARSDAVWNVTGTPMLGLVLNVMPSQGGGIALDLTGPYVTSYSFKKDGRSTLKGARWVGSRQQFIFTVQHQPGGGGDLTAAWTAADVTAAAAGDADSPAYRLFTLNPAFALPDGNNAGTSRLMGGLPMQVIDLLAPTLLGGPGYSQPVIVMYQPTGSTTWISLAGKVSVTIRQDGAGIWVDGQEWLQVYQTAAKIAFTLATESNGHASVLNTGGAGKQYGFVSVPGDVVEALTGTFLGVGSNGSVVTYGGGIFRNDTPRMQAALDAWWNWYSTDRILLTWTEEGVCQTQALTPGMVVDSMKHRIGDGSASRVETINCPVIRRTVRWTQNGPSVTYSVSIPAPDLNAITGQA